VDLADGEEGQRRCGDAKGTSSAEARAEAARKGRVDGIFLAERCVEARRAAGILPAEREDGANLANREKGICNVKR
jgi:hypothetical protein